MKKLAKKRIIAKLKQLLILIAGVIFLIFGQYTNGILCLIWSEILDAKKDD